MEELKYIIEDSTIAELLGVQNFTNDESAVLELVKNSYDAKATILKLQFDDNRLIISDNGVGMDRDDIKRHWMHIGKSDKEYEVVDGNNKKRVLAGSKGVGRFALSRLGKYIQVFTKKEGAIGIVWSTDWNSSQLNEDDSLIKNGTKIEINGLREKWSKKRIENLSDFLSKTCHDNSMRIELSHSGIEKIVSPYFPVPVLGKNCLSSIQIKFDSSRCILSTLVKSDEFLDDAKAYCPKINLKEFTAETNIIDEFKALKELDLSIEELEEYLQKLGDFTAEIYKTNFMKAYNCKCAYCGASIDILPKEMFEIDHFIYEKSFDKKADAGFIENLVLACHSCNHQKGAFSLTEDDRMYLHPDEDTIKKTFIRDEQYYIKVSENQTTNKLVIDFYKKLGLGGEIHRLDYLLMSMIGLQRTLADEPEAYTRFGQAIDMLRLKRNMM